MQRRLISRPLGSLSQVAQGTVITPVRNWFLQRTRQEQMLLIGGGCAAALIILGFVSLSVRDTVQSQRDRYDAILANMRAVEEQLKTHKALLAQRREVEHFFRRVDDHQNPLSQLETLFKNTIGNEARPRITETGTKNFGQQFRQTTLRVSELRMTSLEKLLSVVNALTTGNAPFLITHLMIDKNEGSGKLDVRLDVSTVAKGQVTVERDEQNGTQG